MVSKVCEQYFSGFSELKNFKKNDGKTNTIALLKVLSYFTGLIPLGFAAVSFFAGRKVIPISKGESKVQTAARNSQVIPSKSKLCIKDLKDTINSEETLKQYLERQTNADYIEKLMNEYFRKNIPESKAIVRKILSTLIMEQTQNFEEDKKKLIDEYPAINEEIIEKAIIFVANKANQIKLGRQHQS